MSINNHPLANNNDDDDDDSNLVTIKYMSNDINNSNKFVATSNLVIKRTDSFNTNVPINNGNNNGKPVTINKNKRPAPKPPQSQQQTPVFEISKSSDENYSSCDSTQVIVNNNNASLSEINFFIDINHVRWFYKGDKTDKNDKADKDTANSNNTGSLPSISSASNLTSESLNETSASSSTTNTNDLNNNVNNLRNNSNHISSKKWIMFDKRDSYNLEIEYRDMMSKKLTNASAADTPRNVQVLDSLYEVNLVTRKCNSIYWKSRMVSVMRSIWYNESGEPLEEKISEEIEKKHIDLFKDVLLRSVDSEGSLNLEIESQKIIGSDSTISPNDEITSGGKNKVAEIKIESIGSLTIDDGTITWYSKEEVFWEKNKLSIYDKLQLGISKFRNKFSGIKIKRGFKEKSKDNEIDDKEVQNEEIHLLFVVHGIAQKLYENSIVKNCEDLRREFEKKRKEFFPTSKNNRYVFIPVDWRSSLTLDDGIVESITPKSIQMVRDRLNSSALDVMYYTSPLFRTEIMNSLTSEVNSLYKLFCQKNPKFKKQSGKVSFVAHSLGTVIVYDILTSNNSHTRLSNNYGEDSNQEKMIFNHLSNNDCKLLNEYLNCKNRMQEIERNLINSNNNIANLEFKTENFFSLGSPLGVFLALRGVRPAGNGKQDHILPKHLCQRLFNIFHPSDPVAYRLEPLILKNYSTKAPKEMPKASDFTKQTALKEQNDKRVPLNVDLKSALTKTPTKKKDKDSKSAELNQMKEETFNYASSSQSINLKEPIDQVELEYPLDYQLQDSNFELYAALKAHTCYWKSSDVALFIMQHICNNDASQTT